MNDKIRKMLLERADGKRNDDFLNRVSGDTYDLYELIWKVLLEKYDKERYSHALDEDYILSEQYFILTAREFMNNDRFNGHAWNGLDREPGLALTFNDSHHGEEIVFVYLEDDSNNRKIVFLNTLLKLLEEDGISTSIDYKKYTIVFSISGPSLREKIDDEYVSTYTGI